jgi:hypothetical protein
LPKLTDSGPYTGIVDSLWVKKEGTKQDDYLALRDEMKALFPGFAQEDFLLRYSVEFHVK